MSKVLIIAEAGVNHNGNMDMAKALIDEAAEAEADVIKFQSFVSTELVSSNAPKAAYQEASGPENESQLDMLRKYELNESMHRILMEYCREKKIEFLSTPFDLKSMDLLSNILGIKKIKIASGDITFGPLLLKAAQTQKDVILSTGMSTLSEIEEALMVLAFGYISPEAKPCESNFEKAYHSPEGQERLRKQVTLLHCTSEYPAPFDEVNLRAMQTMKDAFGLQVGFSDHTVGISVPIAATALGAVVIEKHFTLDKTLPGPDHKASLEPSELRAMVRSIREVERSLGSSHKGPTRSEFANRPIVRRSLVASVPLNQNDAISFEHFAFKRPGTGLSPMLSWSYIGTKTKKALKKDEPF